MACVTRRRDRWVLDYYDPQKKRHCVFMKKGAGKNEAIDKLAGILRALGQEAPGLAKEVPSFSEIADLWLGSKKANIRHSTHEQYEGHLNNHLKPYFEQIRVSDIDFEALEKFKKDLLGEHTPRVAKALKQFEKESWFEELKILSEGKRKAIEPEKQTKIEEAEASVKTLSKIERQHFEKAVKFIDKVSQPMKVVTLRKVLVTMGAVLTHAVKMRYLNQNPIRDIEKPKGNSLREEQREMVILNPREIRTLLDNATTQKAKVLFMAAVLTGARQGELLGAEWGDVDWGNSQLLIRRTFNHGKRMDPKSKASRRRIDLAPELTRRLKEWYLASPHKQDSDPIFPSEAGTHWDASHMLTRHYFPALRKAKLPRINFHSLRHFYASQLIDLGENLKYIQTQLGHSSIEVTVNIYGHLLKDKNPEAAKKLQEKIFSQEEDSSEPDQQSAAVER